MNTVYKVKELSDAEFNQYLYLFLKDALRRKIDLVALITKMANDGMVMKVLCAEWKESEK